MIKVKVDQLQTGDIIAEHIINAEKQILLSAGTTLSRKTITMLRLWDIKEVKLHQENDTDDALRLAVQFDEIVHNNSHLFENLNQLAQPDEPKKFPIVLSSIISEKSLQQYEDISHKISQIFMDIENYKNADTLTAISNIICQYVTTTPCVMGYILRPTLKNIHHEHLINHSMSVAIIAGKIAKLLGYSTNALQTIVLGALLHDIGKTILPDTIANRNGSIAPEDETLYQSHVHGGYDLIKSLGLPREATLIVVQHHEYMDGSGFPLHITAAKIHPYSQIVAFADMFDALVHEDNERPNFFDIRSKLTNCGANKISTEIIDIFDHYLNDFIFNINVELSDGRTAEVIYTHPSYMSLVVRTTDGDFIDLNKDKAISIKRTFL